MGADCFVTTAKGKTAKEAFREAVDEAQYKYGHGGYTGTIAEKHDFTMDKGFKPDPASEKPVIEQAQDYAWTKVEDEDKYGPAVGLDLGEGQFLFYGVAKC